MKKKYFLISIIVILIFGCSNNKTEMSPIKETRQDLELIAVYKDGYNALKQGDAFFAANKFLEAEILFPQSEWAPRSALMASYSYYLQNYYERALSNLNRFLTTYPTSKDLVYAHYLIAMCYYETIEDEKKDSAPLKKSKEKFAYIIKNYPDTDFALDAKFKLDLIEDILAAKEMYIGRYYIKKEKWIPAINRFRYVIENYDKTIFVEESLHRLVEINHKLGIESEAQKYAKILGYNYLSSEWYKKSYKIFNQDYNQKLKDPIQKEKKGVIAKFKKLFE